MRNTDWGYKFTVTGTVVRKFRPLRVVDQQLSLKRLGRAMLRLGYSHFDWQGERYPEEDVEEGEPLMTSADAATGGNQDTFSSVQDLWGPNLAAHSGDLEGKTGPSTLRSRMVATLGPGLWRTLLQSQSRPLQLVIVEQ